MCHPIPYCLIAILSVITIAAVPEYETTTFVTAEFVPSEWTSDASFARGISEASTGQFSGVPTREITLRVNPDEWLSRNVQIWEGASYHPNGEIVAGVGLHVQVSGIELPDNSPIGEAVEHWGFALRQGEGDT